MKQRCSIFAYIITASLLTALTEAKNSPPIADAGSNFSIPTNHIVTLSGSASDPDGDPILGWHWQVENAPLGSNYKLADTNTPTPTFRTDSLGSHSIELFAYDGTDWSAPDSIIISAIPPPSLAIETTPDSPQTDQTVLFNPSLTDGIAPFSYHWEFGDENTSTNPTPSYQYAEAGTYGVSLTVTDAYGQTGLDSLDLIVNSATPTVIVSAVPSTGAAPLTVDLYSLVEGGAPPFSFQWDLGNGETSLLQNPTTVYTLPGTYTATVSITDSSLQTDTNTVQVIVATNNVPWVYITASPASGAAPLLVSFSSSIIGGDDPLYYLWDFGDGGDSPLNNPTYQYNLPGTYIASLTVTDQDGDTGIAHIQIRVFAPLTITNCIPDSEGMILEWVPLVEQGTVVKWTTNLVTMPFTNLSTALPYPLNIYTDTVYGVESKCFYKIEMVP